MAGFLRRTRQAELKRVAVYYRRLCSKFDISESLGEFHKPIEKPKAVEAASPTKALRETQKSDQTPGTLIAAVLAHPDTLEKLHNGIVDALSELQTRQISNTAPFIQALIDGANLEQKARKVVPHDQETHHEACHPDGTAG